MLGSISCITTLKYIMLHIYSILHLKDLVSGKTDFVVN